MQIGKLRTRPAGTHMRTQWSEIQNESGSEPEIRAGIRVEPRGNAVGGHRLLCGRRPFPGGELLDYRLRDCIKKYRIYKKRLAKSKYSLVVSWTALSQVFWLLLSLKKSNRK